MLAWGQSVSKPFRDRVVAMGTMLKIDPNYRRGQAVYVTDASRAVGVVSELLSRERRGDYVDALRAEYARMAAAHARGEANKQRLSLSDARANALKLAAAASDGAAVSSRMEIYPRGMAAGRAAVPSAGRTAPPSAGGAAVHSAGGRVASASQR